VEPLLRLWVWHALHEAAQVAARDAGLGKRNDGYEEEREPSARAAHRMPGIVLATGADIGDLAKQLGIGSGANNQHAGASCRGEMMWPISLLLDLAPPMSISAPPVVMRKENKSADGSFLAAPSR
jgi:hypothetical protein